MLAGGRCLPSRRRRRLPLWEAVTDGLPGARPLGCARVVTMASSREGPINTDDYRALAEAGMDSGLRAYVEGGAGDEATVLGNREAFERWWFRPRGLRDVSRVDTRTTVLGLDVSTPVLIAPLAFQRALHPDGEIASARAARMVGTVMCLSTFSTCTPSEVSNAAPGALLWLQVYALRDRSLTRSLIGSAIEAGAKALVLTIDTPRLGSRERDLRSGFTLEASIPVPILRGATTDAMSAASLFNLVDPAVTWEWVDELVEASPVPVVVKGVLTAEDAHLACEHGISAIVVSNHGGRQLDGAIPSLDALPEIVAAVGGRAEIYLDGGVRRGTDVAKALALGARAVFVGRPIAWGLSVGGEDGVSDVLTMVSDELALTLALLGCSSPDELSASHVVRSPS
jgi:4-hydroxymandelate oxidase